MNEKEFNKNYDGFAQKIIATVNAGQLPLVVKRDILNNIILEISQKIQMLNQSEVTKTSEE